MSKTTQTETNAPEAAAKPLSEDVIRYCEYINNVHDQLDVTPMDYIALLIDPVEDAGIIPYIAAEFPDAKMTGPIADGRLRILVYKD